MKLGPLTTESIDYVFDNLSERSVKDFVDAGVSEKAAKERWHELEGAPFTGTVWDKDEAVALLSLIPRGFMTWKASVVMIAGGWERVSLPLTRFFALFTTDFVDRTHGTVIGFSSEGKGKIFDWYRTLGFRCDGEQASGLYRYSKRPR